MVLSETNKSTNVTTRYWHGLDTLAQSDGTTTQYFAYDGLGSVRQLVDASGSVGLAQTFDPYGNGYARAGSVRSSFGYSGEQVDSNGFVFLRARYYNPAYGRFFQRDTFRGSPDYPLTLNPYMYGLGNPILHIDPSGMIAPLILAALIGAGVGVAAFSLFYIEMWHGACGCDLENWAKSLSIGEFFGYMLVAGVVGAAMSTGGALLAGILTPQAMAAVGVVASAIAGTQIAQQIELDPLNLCHWTALGIAAVSMGLSAKNLGLGIGIATGKPIVIAEEIPQGSPIYQEVFAKNGVQNGERLYGAVFKDGKVIAWLEEGSSEAGWSHIVQNRGIGTANNQFSEPFGLTTDQQTQGFILKYAAQVVQEGVEYSGNISVAESTQYLLHLEVGDNGFIVTAYPISK